MKIEQEYSVSHEQFLEGMTEMIKMTTEILETFKKAYIKTGDPFCKIAMQGYAEVLANSVKLLKSYTIRIENGIGVNPIILFSDGIATFGYRITEEVNFSKRWFKKITKSINGKQMVS